jgi:acetylornithine/succinyldiaminopimelate/putrescine aminotransferase
MIGLKMREASDALKLQNALYERGVLVLTAAGGVLRLMPPLVVNEHETEWFIEAMRSSLAES